MDAGTGGKSWVWHDLQRGLWTCVAALSLSLSALVSASWLLDSGGIWGCQQTLLPALPAVRWPWAGVMASPYTGVTPGPHSPSSCGRWPRCTPARAEVAKPGQCLARSARLTCAAVTLSLCRKSTAWLGGYISAAGGET